MRVTSQEWGSIVLCWVSGCCFINITQERNLGEITLIDNLMVKDTVRIKLTHYLLLTQVQEPVFLRKLCRTHECTLIHFVF